MELYVFLITSFIRLAAAMVVFFNCSSATVPYISFNKPIGTAGIQTIKRLKKLRVCKRIKAHRELIFITEMRIERSGLSGKKTNAVFAKSAVTTKTII